jgi:hypothetical protein
VADRNPGVEILGIKQLRRDLIALDRDYFPKAFVEAGMKVAEPLVGAVRSALPHLTGNMADTVRVAKIRTGAAIRVGTAAYPSIGPLEFGGYPRPGGARWAGGAFREGGTLYNRAVSGGRPFVAGGRFVFPTAQGTAPKAAEEYSKAVQDAIDRYPWSTPTS